MDWLVTFQSMPEYLEKYEGSPRATIRVRTAMEGDAVSQGWKQLVLLRRSATKDNHFLYSVTDARYSRDGHPSES